MKLFRKLFFLVLSLFILSCVHNDIKKMDSMLEEANRDFQLYLLLLLSTLQENQKYIHYELTDVTCDVPKLDRETFSCATFKNLGSWTKCKYFLDTNDSDCKLRLTYSICEYDTTRDNLSVGYQPLMKFKDTPCVSKTVKLSFTLESVSTLTSINPPDVKHTKKEVSVSFPSPRN
ncbi:MAG: hypothetical protein NZ853_02130 [Leptospiraceae bacterium]|nr:hypothetical protein [Leptospiraceae bacterium]